MIKVAAPQMTQTVCDRAMQAFGGMGVSADTPIAGKYSNISSSHAVIGCFKCSGRGVAFHSHCLTGFKCWKCSAVQS